MTTILVLASALLDPTPSVHQTPSSVHNAAAPRAQVRFEISGRVEVLAAADAVIAVPGRTAPAQTRSVSAQVVSLALDKNSS